MWLIVQVDNSRCLLFRYYVISGVIPKSQLKQMRFHNLESCVSLMEEKQIECHYYQLINMVLSHIAILSFVIKIIFS